VVVVAEALETAKIVVAEALEAVEAEVASVEEAALMTAVRSRSE
jgi:hypothetical protein